MVLFNIQRFGGKAFDLVLLRTNGQARREPRDMEPLERWHEASAECVRRLWWRVVRAAAGDTLDMAQGSGLKVAHEQGVDFSQTAELVAPTTSNKQHFQNSETKACGILKGLTHFDTWSRTGLGLIRLCYIAIQYVFVNSNVKANTTQSFKQILIV